MDGVIQRDKNEEGHRVNNEDFHISMDKYKNVQRKYFCTFFIL